jgi:hypothetical protein
LVYAQTGAGNIQGTAKDPTGAVVPGADVTVLHLQTNRQHESITNDTGFFLFPSLQTGNYKITVQAPAMQTWQGELLLQVGQTAVVDAVLRIAATLTEVTVVGDVTPLVTSRNARMSE